MERSLYKQYVEERTASHVIETDSGFVKYQFIDDGVYIEDIFIVKEMRKERAASEFADIVADEARIYGYRTMYGSVCVDAKNPDISMKVLLGYGMTPFRCDGNMIYFKKEI